MYMAGLKSEQEFDELAEQFGLYDQAGEITCSIAADRRRVRPAALPGRRYDVYRRVRGPKEFSVVENGFHMPSGTANFGGLDIYPFIADWLRDALAGEYGPGHAREILVREDGGVGTYETESAGYWLPERAESLGG